jgi:hypothetical protein
MKKIILIIIFFFVYKISFSQQTKEVKYIYEYLNTDRIVDTTNVISLEISHSYFDKLKYELGRSEVKKMNSYKNFIELPINWKNLDSIIIYKEEKNNFYEHCRGYVRTTNFSKKMDESYEIDTLSKCTLNVKTKWWWSYKKISRVSDKIWDKLLIKPEHSYSISYSNILMSPDKKYFILKEHLSHRGQPTSTTVMLFKKNIKKHWVIWSITRC